jgi:hypothetical protein
MIVVQNLPGLPQTAIAKATERRFPKSEWCCQLSASVLDVVVVATTLEKRSTRRRRSYHEKLHSLVYASHIEYMVKSRN